MPTVILDRIPLPNLKLYTTVSVLLVSCCLYYAIVTTNEPNWRVQNNMPYARPYSENEDAVSTAVDAMAESVVRPYPSDGAPPSGESEISDKSIDRVESASDGIRETEIPFVAEHSEQSDVCKVEVIGEAVENLKQAVEDKGTDNRDIAEQVKDVFSFMCQDPMCIWTLINMAYCCLILLGKSIQKVVFGELRISEQQHLKDKFWNFAFYKCIFVFGVINVQFLHEVVLWVSWFSILGFLHLLSQLCKDRFEYLSFSPTTPGWSHIRLVGLLSSILTLSGFMFIICVGVGFFGGLNTFAFMAAECVLLLLRTMHVLIRYCMFLYEMRQGGEVVSWDKRGPFAYYIELAFDVASLTVDLTHHMHMLFWSNIFLSMASLVIVMHLRYLTHEIQRKFKKHRNYLWVLNHMEKTYPLATAEDLLHNSDNCAICWEKMETARKLPCCHLFHNSCLQSWLEQDTSCPTCRLALSVQQSVSPHPPIDRIEEPDTTNRRTQNHFFQFNGSRYVSWLPNFSVEVTNITSVLRAEPPPQQAMHTTSQTRNMARQVQQMFPNYPLSVIMLNLYNSRSMEATIDNILEGRLPNPPGHFFNEDEFPDMAGPSVVATTATQSNGSEYSMSSESSSDSEYEIERNSNIFGNQNELLRDESLEDIPLGDRFSKSSNEREKILHRRKEMLLAVARKRYLEKRKSELNMSTSDVVRNRNKTSIESEV